MENVTNTPFEQLSEEDKLEIQNFSERLNNGEVTEEEIKSIEGSLTKDDTRQIRMIKSEMARQRRRDIKAVRTRVHRRATKKMVKRSKKSNRKK